MTDPERNLNPTPDQAEPAIEVPVTCYGYDELFEIVRDSVIGRRRGTEPVMLYREEINDGLILKSEVFFQVGSNRNNYGFSARFDLSPEKSDYYSNPERIDRIRQIATERLIKSLHSIHPLDIDQERSNEVNYSHDRPNWLA